MRIGYARVSTTDQNSDLQEDALQKAGCEKIFHNVASGAVDSRKGVAEMNESGKRKVSGTAPRGFVRQRWALGFASNYHVGAAASAPAGHP